MTLLGILSDLFRGENVTSIWVIKGSRMEEPGTCTYILLECSCVKMYGFHIRIPWMRHGICLATFWQKVEDLDA